MRGRVRRMFRHNAYQHETRLERAAAVMGPEPTPAPFEPPQAPQRVSGARSANPRAFQVLAEVKRGDQTDVVFLVEYQKLHDAIIAASVYPYRAHVVNCHSKREFSNGKPIEVEA